MSKEPGSTNTPEANPWAQLIRRALEDPDFRESLIADPRTTITDATGTELPDNVEIVVVEDTPNRMHIVLPSTDIDLEELAVSGGTGWNDEGGLRCNSWQPSAPPSAGPGCFLP